MICYAHAMYMHMQCICFEKCEFCFAGIVCSEITPKKKKGKKKRRGSCRGVYGIVILGSLASPIRIMFVVDGSREVDEVRYSRIEKRRKKAVESVCQSFTH